MNELEKHLYKDYLQLKKIFKVEFPKGFSWGWQRWCMENCNSIGQCDWIRENCPFTHFELKLFKAS